MIRGDANASLPVRPSNSRDNLFQYFCERIGLLPILSNHKTYHHFTGNESSVSAIDVILHKNFWEVRETEKFDNINIGYKYFNFRK